MEFVKNLNAAKKNIRYLWDKRQSNLDAENEAASTLIVNGVKYAAFVDEGVLYCGPSRFVGYENNSLDKHSSNYLRHGNLTDKRLSEIFGSPPKPNSLLDSILVSACSDVGMTMSKKSRSYWWDSTLGDLLCLEPKPGDLPKTAVGKTRLAIIKQRIGQEKFRDAVRDHWNEKCAISSLDLLKVLQACHIKPWAESNEIEKVDHFNGLLLSPNLHTLFDGGLITIDSRGKVLVSRRLSRLQRKSLGLENIGVVNLEAGHEKYLRNHRRKFDKLNRSGD
jgi:putative restriction endonuclease